MTTKTEPGRRAVDLADDAKQCAIGAFFDAHLLVCEAAIKANRKYTPELEAAEIARDEALDDLINAECTFRAAVKGLANVRRSEEQHAGTTKH
ncbi:hypothetical protein MTX26_01785 [Bradyrhizobium sp. ISRA443]|uniref:hypothetical protein n=1 Tax=unclassified Bradyrhizobium TaxID=2631580 RepID=UPI00247ACDBA|nr:MULTISPECIES: hypothetical protein [unclassified Bradyrhizobium]WGR94799.1 hypothetical protein MTX20_11815 [Bradyrhizobium sp. ISRA435]WGR99630.1 hypothetical protein MTX23_01785 [Bradyrhizobium sp. ISRA436]WGS06520.1 hypothetical protein MTX18_01785 [Bradyrhizobium sp. ISRA437]WGS13404.1 hypothetical protein MTX26_01785 [Bradyrhizobium sp. ISRA443]